MSVQPTTTERCSHQSSAPRSDLPSSTTDPRPAVNWSSLLDWIPSATRAPSTPLCATWNPMECFGQNCTTRPWSVASGTYPLVRSASVTASLLSLCDLKVWEALLPPIRAMLTAVQTHTDDLLSRLFHWWPLPRMGRPPARSRCWNGDQQSDSSLLWIACLVCCCPWERPLWSSWHHRHRWLWWLHRMGEVII